MYRRCGAEAAATDVVPSRQRRWACRRSYWNRSEPNPRGTGHDRDVDLVIGHGFDPLAVEVGLHRLQFRHLGPARLGLVAGAGIPVSTEADLDRPWIRHQLIEPRVDRSMAPLFIDCRTL